MLIKVCATSVKRAGNMQKMINILVPLFFIILGTSDVAADGFWAQLFNSKKEIIANVNLVNKCDLEDRYFIVRNLETGKYALFENGIAKIKANKNASLQLQLSPSVKYIKYEGVAVAAKEKMTITADCSKRSLEMIENN